MDGKEAKDLITLTLDIHTKTTQMDKKCFSDSYKWFYPIWTFLALNINSMLFDSIAVHSPYCRTNVVVKMILNESANDAGFPNSSVLKREGRGHTHTEK